MASNSFAGMIEADLRNLSAEARKSEPGFAGYFGGTQHPEIKEAAERALLKLRSLPPENLNGSTIAACEEVWKAFMMACEAKNTRLSVVGLASLQKLVANDAISAEPMPKVLAVLRQHADIYEEAVQLKTLQTVLTILQSKLFPEEEEGVSQLVGICFRLLASPRCADSVHTTAAATLRQAVALIFDRICVLEGLGQSKKVDVSLEDIESKGPGQDCASKAGFLLFNDLCALASAQPAPWLQVPSLPKAFALDMLEYLLANHAIVFKSLPNFERLLGGRLASVLMTSLRADRVTEDEAAEMLERRLLMRTVTTVVKQFAQVLCTEVEIYLSVLLKTLEQDFPLWHRIFVLEVLRSIAGDAPLIRLLYETYDGKGGTGIVRDLVIVLARHVHSATQLGQGMDQILHHMAHLFTNKAQGVEWSPDMENLLAGGIQQEAFAVALATDGLLCLIEALSKLADQSTPPPSTQAPLPLPLTTAEAALEAMQEDPQLVASKVVRATTCQLVESLWEILLLPLSILLSRASGEALVLDLLKGYQSFTHTCGVVEVTVARDAFLASLCDFTLSQHQPSSHMLRPSTSQALTSSTSFGANSERSLSGLTQESASGEVPDLEGAVAGMSMAPPPPGSLAPGVPPAGQGTPEGGGGPGMGGGALGPGPALTPDTSDGLLLSPKNVHALRTLFNIAHQLSGNLGPSWVVVLETLSMLEQALQSPRTTTQEGQLNHRRSGERPCELEVLSTAATQLFESTVMLDDNAVISLLTALRDVSSKAARQMSQGGGGAPSSSSSSVHHPGQPSARLFALGRLVDVVLHNVNRMATLWPLLVQHLQEVLEHPQPAVRGAALQAFDRAVAGALAAASRVPPDPASQQAPFELVVLQPLEAMLFSQWEDVRMGSLRILSHALQRAGDHLTVAWRAVISMLTKVAAPTGAGPPPQGTGALPPDLMAREQAQPVLVGVAFQSVQMIAQDYLGTVPEDSLQACVAMTTAFAAQKADLNVALTAIGLMWNMADFFGRTIESLLNIRPDQGGGGEEGGTGDLSGSKLERDRHAQAKDKAALIAEALLLPLFTSLQSLCTDERPEVRNSGLRTLLSTLVSHGAKLPPVLWRRCLWEILFPLLDTVRALAASSSKEESVGTQLGQERGRAVMMLIHHSRNSEQKQWDETLVLCLNGMGRLLRTYMGVLVTLDGFEARWDSFLAFFETSVIESNREVALAAIASFTHILQTHAGTPSLPRPLWKRAIRAYVQAVRGAASMNSKVSLRIRCELVSSLGRLYSSKRLAFDEADLRALLALLDALARQPFAMLEPQQGAGAAGGLAPIPSQQDVQAQGLPPVQRAVLEFLPMLAPFDERHIRAGLWGALFHMLLAYIPGEKSSTPETLASRILGSDPRDPTVDPSMPPSVLLMPAQEEPSTSSDLSQGPGSQAHIFMAHCPVTGEKVETSPGALSAVFAERVLHVVLGLYKEHAPTDTRALMFAPLVSGLGECLTTRAQQPEGTLWRTATSALVAVTRIGLPAVNLTKQASAQQALQQRAEVMETMGIGSGGPGGSRRGHPDEVWHALVDAFGRLLLPGQGVLDRAASANIAPDQRRQDEELELAGLDALCDAVLPACASAPDHLRRRLVAIVDCGVDRPIPPEGYTGGERFSHVCLRKLYVLVSRGGEAEGPHACTLAIARHALPVLLTRCQALLQAYAQDDHSLGVGTGGHLAPSRFEEMMCVLEVLETMNMDSRVSNWMAEGNDDFAGHAGIASILSARRQSENYSHAREQTHLLFLYGSLAQLVMCRDVRIREQVQKLLLLVGKELALIPGDPSPVAIGN